MILTILDFVLCTGAGEPDAQLCPLLLDHEEERVQDAIHGSQDGQQTGTHLGQYHYLGKGEHVFNTSML